MDLQPALPRDLEQVIVELAVEDIRFPLKPSNTYVNVQLTARRFHAWIEPFLFRVLNKDIFETHLKRMGTSHFIDRLRYIGKHTKHLAYTIDTYDVKSDHIRLKLLIECCPNLLELSIRQWLSSDTLCKDHETVSKLMGLRRLSAGFKGLQREDILCPTYLGLTHLDLMDNLDPDLIHHFQNLTHLRIDMIRMEVTWRTLLVKATDKESGCQALQVIILDMVGIAQLCSHYNINIALPEHVDRSRCVVLTETPYFRRNWLKQANGAMDAWEFCERIVMAKKKGYLSNPSKQAFSMDDFRVHKELTSQGQVPAPMDHQPILPPEIEQAIVEIVGEDICFPFVPDRTIFPNVQLTARRFYDWMQPSIFRVMNKRIFKIHLRRMGPRFIDSLRYLGKYTTHLAYTIDGAPAIAQNRDHTRLQLLIECCPNLVDLAIWHTSDTLSKVHETVSKLTKLRRLSASFEGMPKEQILCPTYLGLTHLEVVGGIDAQIITHFQNLTHLAISVSSDLDWRSVLDRATDKDTGCPSLRIIITVNEDPLDLIDAAALQYDDQRYVSLLDASYFEVDWLDGAYRGMDAWRFAECIVFARSMKYLKTPSKQAFSISPYKLHEELNSAGQEWWGKPVIEFRTTHDD
ncbi:hypothetical protein CVT24_003431 [Panaeolus cyanescens]|uniref:Uncharacterized protein n=1 Tax=Panaeolus cyanescens TaxID=181874 RepID=A0A409Y700_9AGAR|nr:hypothetical protein CVT24_003431 [Panaeolus cyanescens]